MKNPRLWKLCTLLTVMMMPSLVADAQSPPAAATVTPDVAAPGHVKALMRGKLEHAKAILEGLALEDYDKVASNARSLRLLSTETGWKILQTKQYQQHSEAFRQNCDSIEKSAKNKDVSRATLGYVSLTMRCVECHRYIRENKLVKTSFSLGGEKSK